MSTKLIKSYHYDLFFFFFYYLKQKKNPNTSLPPPPPNLVSAGSCRPQSHQSWQPPFLDLHHVGHPSQPLPTATTPPKKTQQIWIFSFSNPNLSKLSIFLVNFLKNILILGLLVLDVLDCLWIPYLFGFFWWSDGGWWDWLRCLAWCRLGDGKKF